VRNAANTADSIVIDRTRITGNYITVTAANTYTSTDEFASDLINKPFTISINFPFTAANPAPSHAKIEVI
jgi:hypothetical protein